MSPRKRIQKHGINPIYLLNTSIDELYEADYLSARVYYNLRSLEVKNLAELRDIIFKSREGKKEDRLEIFGLRSVQEVNELFHRAKIKIPEIW